MVPSTALSYSRFGPRTFGTVSLPPQPPQPHARTPRSHLRPYTLDHPEVFRASDVVSGVVRSTVRRTFTSRTPTRRSCTARRARHGTPSRHSCRRSASAQATVTPHFTGSAVDIFGLVRNTCGEYWAAVDGSTLVTLTVYNKGWTKLQTLLCMARSLNDGPHTLNLAADNSNMLNIDYAVVYGNNPSAGIASGDEMRSIRWVAYNGVDWHA